MDMICLYGQQCVVHDKFNEAELLAATQEVTNQGLSSVILAHPESPLPVLKADYVGSTSGMLNYVKNFQGNNSTVIFVATEDGILYNMKMARPELDIRQAPIYKG